MDRDYFSIESILAENQKISCDFKVDIPEMGHLGGGNERDIKAPCRIPLPVWLADWAEFTIPTPFGPRVRNALKAEARSVRLSSLVGAGGMWYGYGKMIMDMKSAYSTRPLKHVSPQTFRNRLMEVVDQAQHFATLGSLGAGGSSGDTAQSFREGLDATERELFSLAQESAKRTKRWYEESDRGRR
ncbi:GINS complex Psf3 component [Athelia psychrophila]|uniref:DNA replication complex GINS protein PSF3 n=1 Tax=Athelia psychrophila TaxID=1759441 RepID=A0A166N2E0_9AGAM|nr:GINS complex Psf3 component [Fibularhizoctonia sp. CBS 109695]